MSLRVVDSIRLEIESDPDGLVNLVPNPSGEFGAWGYQKPPDGASLTGALRSLLFTISTAGGEFHLATESIPVTAGQWVVAGWTHYSITPGARYRARILWMDANQAQIGQTEQTGDFFNSIIPSDNRGVTSRFQAPAGTVYARLRWDFYSNSDGNPPVSSFVFNEATLVAVDAESDLPGFALPFVEPITWTNVIGDSNAIQVDRDELNVGTLSATVISTALDPATSDLIRPNRRIRLTAKTGVDSSGADIWEPIFTGVAREASVSYNFVKTPAAKQATITISATDDLDALARVARASTVATIPELPYVLEGAGVPWNCNGNGNQVATATVVAYNEDDSAVDQVAITRDTAHGWAWLDRFGVLQVWGPGHISHDVRATLDETVYASDVTIDFDTNNCINEVTVTALLYNPATSATGEQDYGPFRNEDSIKQWGEHPVTYTVAGITSKADAQAFATPILTQNAVPVRIITTANVPLHDGNLDLATIDLYDLLTCVNTKAGINGSHRATSVSHAITASTGAARDSWIMTIGFAADGAQAVAQSVPPVGGATSIDVEKKINDATAGDPLAASIGPTSPITFGPAMPASASAEAPASLWADGSTLYVCTTSYTSGGTMDDWTVDTDPRTRAMVFANIAQAGQLADLLNGYQTTISADAPSGTATATSRWVQVPDWGTSSLSVSSTISGAWQGNAAGGWDPVDTGLDWVKQAFSQHIVGIFDYLKAGLISGATIIATDGAGTTTFQVDGNTGSVTIGGYATSSALSSVSSTASGAATTASNAQTTANNAIPKTGGTLSGLLSMSGGSIVLNGPAGTIEIYSGTTLMATISSSGFTNNGGFDVKIRPRLRVDPNEYFAGTTLSSGDIAAGGALWFNNGTYANTNNANLNVGSGGRVYQGAAASSRTLKYGIEPADVRSDLDALRRCGVFAFHYHNDEQRRLLIGLIIEDMLAAGLRRYVDYDEDGNPYQPAWQQITALLIAGWQDHDRRLEALEATLTRPTALEAS